MFIFISAGIGLLLSIILWLNIKESSLFYRECPYNYPSSENDHKYFLKELEKANNAKKNKMCSRPRCYLQSENLEEKFSHGFICNFDSSDEFPIELNKVYTKISPSGNELQSTSLIECQKLNSTLTDIEKMDINIYEKKFFSICNSKYDSLYKCERFEKPKKLNIKKDYICPAKNYVTVSYLFGVFTIITDILLTFIPWSFDYSSYSEIIKITESENENNESQSQEEEKNITNKDTEQTENIVDNNTNGILNLNRKRNDNEYERAPTETIIIEPNEQKSKSIKKTKNNKNKKKDENNIINIIISLKKKKKSLPRKIGGNNAQKRYQIKKNDRKSLYRDTNSNNIDYHKKYMDDDSEKDFKNTTVNNFKVKSSLNKIIFNQFENNHYTSGRAKQMNNKLITDENINSINQKSDKLKKKDIKSLKTDVMSGSSGNKKSDNKTGGNISETLSIVGSERVTLMTNANQKKNKLLILTSSEENKITEEQK